MLHNIWRYSHFILAVSSVVFILILSITGIFLAVEPIQKQWDGPSQVNLSEISVGESISVLRDQYDEVFELTVTEEGFVKAEVMRMDDDIDGTYYIHPQTGDILSTVPERQRIYEFMTNLHRSLFLKQTGRIIIGFTSFFLFLIAITGTLLLIRRQNGIKHFFKKITKEDPYQFYHVILGKWSLIPIVIISLTGVYLSLDRFEVLTESEQDWAAGTEFTEPGGHTKDPIVQNFLATLTLAEVSKIEFPFSPDEEDYFIIENEENTYQIHQYSGALVQFRPQSSLHQWAKLSYNLHTGIGQPIWALILLIACINILYFIYSGAQISVKRLRSNVKNKVSAKEAEIVILVGSENGSTFGFAKVLQRALLQQRQSVYIDDLNQYQVYPKLKDLIVLTSTYGDGDPPANARQFLNRFETIANAPSIQWAILGFGSYAYTQFCQYAKEIEQAFLRKQWGTPIQPLGLIHNKSYPEFKQWAESWGQSRNLRLELPAELKKKKNKEYEFTVVKKSVVDDGFGITFLLQLQSKYQRFDSGDLLGVIPPGSTEERWYSIAKLESGDVLLSIKIHEGGLCSNYLYQLNEGAKFVGSIKINSEFHWPQQSDEVVLIANGTGIAPYLGMLLDAKKVKNKKIRCIWGGKNSKAYDLYKPYLEQANGSISDVKIAYSREAQTYRYVQDIVQADMKPLCEILSSGGSLMICGAVSMQNDVLRLLTTNNGGLTGPMLNDYIQKGQIRMDCY